MIAAHTNRVKHVRLSDTCGGSRGHVPCCETVDGCVAPGGADDRWFVKIDCSALQQLVTLAGPSLPSVLIANDALGS